MPKGINDPDVIDLLNLVLPDPKLQKTPPAAIADVRKRIPDARKAINISFEIPDQFTRDFVDALVKRKLFPGTSAAPGAPAAPGTPAAPQQR